MDPALAAFARAPARIRGEAAFTLVEMAVTLAMVAVVAALAGPAFGGFLGRQALKGAAGEAFSDLQYARSTAVQRNQTVKVTFDAGGYSITTGSPPTTLKSITLNSGNQLSGTPLSVEFDPVRTTATITPAGKSVLLANASVPGTVRLTVNPAGRPEICTPDGLFPGYPPC